MLLNSQLLSFLDQKNDYLIHFFEGQKVVNDLAVLHNLKGEGFHYFRNAVLTLLPMVSFLKKGETLGLYIDSDIPYFRLKLETNFSGHLRTLLLPEDFCEFPEYIQGRARLIKHFPFNKAPYTSIIEFPEISLQEIVNQFLKNSYQTKAFVKVGEMADQGLMIAQLPSQDTPLSPQEYYCHKADLFDFILNHDCKSEDEIKNLIEQMGEKELTLLGSKNIHLSCHCSRARMLENLSYLFQSTYPSHEANENPMEDFFQQDEFLELKCDYCKTNYLITKNDLINFLKTSL